MSDNQPNEDNEEIKEQLISPNEYQSDENQNTENNDNKEENIT